ncbi:N-acetyltransferase [Dyella ginsengisoli]|jgi:predicted GNAT family acetyltransferase|uniref:N-acetyltransferase n=1 Tax=Dyella ginsengisoli TaxID=363848 RepID=A0ABW8JUD8_9GAMM
MQIQDNPARTRFEAIEGDNVAFAAYALAGDTITFTHTIVPEAMRGKGVATALIRAALASARQRGLRVTPRCPFFLAYMKQHRDDDDLLSPEGCALVAS